ncbi:MAG: hypothetical protein ACK4TR_08855 [Phenylobacterium sp.]|uniref:hypothetical protein n=1 Tax=Phenylobacterium sp. TaxID=1871053 RepID=UPI00391D549C
MADTIPSTTTAQLANRISNLLDWAEARDGKWTAWVTGTETGGPNGDGRYPLPYDEDEDVLVECPTLLANMLVGPAAAAQAALGLAEAARDRAVQAETAVAAAQSASEAARNAAVAARDLALSYQNQAGTHEGNAAAHAAAAQAARAASEAVSADLTQKHDTVAALAAQVDTQYDAVIPAAAQVAADRVAVEAARDAVEADASAVSSAASTVASQAAQVDTQHAAVIAAQADVVTRQADVTSKQSDVVTKHAAVVSALAATESARDLALQYRDQAQAIANSVDGTLLSNRIDGLEDRIDAIEANPLPLVATPLAVSPTAGATGLMDEVVFTLGPYRSLYDVAQQGFELRISADPTFSTGVITRSDGAVSTHQLPPGLLQTSTVYYWQGRYQDADGVWSPWSAARSFTTTTTFVVIAAPIGTSPAQFATGVSLRPTLQLSAFSVTSGSDTHVETEWQLRLTSDPWSASIYWFTTGTDLRNWTPPVDLLPFTSYHWRARFRGASGVWSPWSNARNFTTQVAYGSQTFTSNGTFTVPPNVTTVRVICIGGGGAGGNDYVGTQAPGGGTSSFGAHCSATGGQGGRGVTSNIAAGGTGIGGDENHTGGSGGRAEQAEVGGNASGPYAAGGGASARYTVNSTLNGGLGGNDPPYELSGNGGSTRANTGPTNPTNYGGGGAGGGGGSNAQGAGGGGGGGGCRKVVSGLTPGDTVAVTVGLGGVALANTYYGYSHSRGTDGAPGVVFVEWGF